MNKITAYTDGSATVKYPYKGGFGIYIKTEKKNYKMRKGFCLTKTGRMELTAAITCLRSIKNKKSIVTIYSDSMYVVNTCNEWLESWERKCWIDLKNVDLLKQLLFELRQFKRKPLLKHIKGHQEGEDKHIVGNNIADELASYKSQKDWERDLSFEHFELNEVEKEDFILKENKKYYWKDEEN